MHTNDNLEAIYAEAARVSEGPPEVLALVFEVIRAYVAAQAASEDATAVVNALLDELTTFVTCQDSTSTATDMLVGEIARAHTRLNEAIDSLRATATAVRMKASSPDTNE